MKKYIFLIKKAIKNEVEIDAENKNEAFKKLVNLVTEDEDKILQNDPDKQIMRFKLKEIIEENDDGIEEKHQYKRDEELVKIIEELDENEDDFISNFRKYL
jgi:hypothetical protein